MKVGIDLSSTNTGLVILSDDNKLIFNGNFQLWDVDYKERFHKVADFVKTIDNKNCTMLTLHCAVLFYFSLFL